MEWFAERSSAWFGPVWGPVFYQTSTSIAFIVAIVVPLFLAVAYLTLWERKMIGWMQIRIGPNRVGPLGLLQPIADGVKLLFKEIILPANASKALYFVSRGNGTSEFSASLSEHNRNVSRYVLGQGRNAAPGPEPAAPAAQQAAQPPAPEPEQGPDQ